MLPGERGGEGRGAGGAWEMPPGLVAYVTQGFSGRGEYDYASCDGEITDLTRSSHRKRLAGEDTALGALHSDREARS
jgi:hypothetical protein